MFDEFAGRNEVKQIELASQEPLATLLFFRSFLPRLRCFY